MRVVVFGGRQYLDVEFAERRLDELDALFGFTHVITGGATGADSIGHAWGVTRGKEVTQRHATWRDERGYNPKAGFERNQAMIDLDRPEVGVMFPGRGGTADMARRMKAAGLPVVKAVAA